MLNARPHPIREAAVFVSRGTVKITLNGQAMDVRDGLSVEELLGQLGVRREYTAVAVNRDVTPKNAYASTRLVAGDRVEIVRPMGGG